MIGHEESLFISIIEKSLSDIYDNDDYVCI